MIDQHLLTRDVRALALNWLREGLPAPLAGALALGLPEWDARLDCWRVALVPAGQPRQPVGELQVDRDGAVIRAPEPALIAERLKALAPGKPTRVVARKAERSKAVAPGKPTRVVARKAERSKAVAPGKPTRVVARKAERSKAVAPGKPTRVVARKAERLRAVAPGKPARRVVRKADIAFPPVPNKVVLGDCRAVLPEFPPDSVQLVFTSPPYFNAKPECAEYVDYSSYLDFLEQAFASCHTVLAEGRFLVVNVSPVLVRRTSRSTASKRLPIPFDLHPILDRIGFEFIDDIIWRKPEGAGWHLGRGRRFAADRQPLQYKPVTVTEYLLVYRKKTDRLIDWNLRNHPDRTALERSLIRGEYDKTNVWDLTPASHAGHPAVFPEELVSRVIRYYSIEGDSVLDPFAGVGTAGRVAASMGRRFVLVEKRRDYFEVMQRELGKLPNTGPVDFDDLQYRWSADDAELVRP